MSMSNLPLRTFILLWLLILVVPLFSLFVWSFLAMRDYAFTFELTLDAYRQIVATGRHQVVWQTLRIALTVTLILLVIAVPFALWLAKGVRSNSTKAIVLALLTVPFFLSLSARVMVLRPILSRSGPINTLLMDLGLADAPLDWLLFSEFAVHLGLLSIAFPSMVFPIYLAMMLIDDEYIDAARDLGAAPRRVFVDVILPLSLPGIIAGAIFTFVPMLGESVVAQLLGGGQVNLLGGSIASLIQVINYAVAAALAVIVLLLLGAFLLFLRFISSRGAGLDKALAGARR